MMSAKMFQSASRRIVVHGSSRLFSTTSTAATLKATVKNEGTQKVLFTATATGLVAATVMLSYYREVRIESIESLHVIPFFFSKRSIAASKLLLLVAT